jgi:predicted metal-dependent phosphoesterase TrpH
MKYIDLHIHTTTSDGTFTPTELIDYAVVQKLSAVAITDHDTMDGIEEALDYIKQNNLPVELLPGIEISSLASGSSFGLHILAYFIDKSDSELTDIIKRVRSSFQKKSYSIEDTIKLIKELNGISVLAHPKEYYLSMTELDSLIGELVPIGLNGIECFYTTHSEGEIQEMCNIASRHGILATGGTDFHGNRKPGVDLGRGFGNLLIPYSVVIDLKSKVNALIK